MEVGCQHLLYTHDTKQSTIINKLSRLNIQVRKTLNLNSQFFTADPSGSFLRSGPICPDACISSSVRLRRVILVFEAASQSERAAR